MARLSGWPGTAKRLARHDQAAGPARPSGWPGMTKRLARHGQAAGPARPSGWPGMTKKPFRAHICHPARTPVIPSRTHTCHSEPHAHLSFRAQPRNLNRSSFNHTRYPQPRSQPFQRRTGPSRPPPWAPSHPLGPPLACTRVRTPNNGNMARTHHFFFFDAGGTR